MTVLRYHSLNCVCVECLLEDTWLAPEYGGWSAFPDMEIKVIPK